MDADVDDASLEILEDRFMSISVPAEGRTYAAAALELPRGGRAVGVVALMVVVFVVVGEEEVAGSVLLRFDVWEVVFGRD